VWHGRQYRVPMPVSARRATLFVTLEGLAEPPPGDAILVLPRRPSLLDLFRGSREPVQLRLVAEPLDD
jgi:hypothetical protein